MSDELKEYVKEMTEKHWEDVEKFTRIQVEEALMQAFRSGDFARVVRAGTNEQAVQYIPFYQKQQLENQILELQKDKEALIKSGFGQCTSCDSARCVDCVGHDKWKRGE